MTKKRERRCDYEKYLKIELIRVPRGLHVVVYATQRLILVLRVKLGVELAVGGFGERLMTKVTRLLTVPFVCGGRIVIEFYLRHIFTGESMKIRQN